MFVPGRLDDALMQLGSLLAERGHAFDVVIIGGGGLQLLGLISRPTEDVDLLALRRGSQLVSVEDGLPTALREAVEDVARVSRLDPTWMNGVPSMVLRLGLPAGFLDRAQRRSYHTLGVTLASRLDQIHLKLYAAADDAPGGKHHRDLVPRHSEFNGLGTSIHRRSLRCNSSSSNEEPIVVAPCARRASTPATHHLHCVEVLERLAPTLEEMRLAAAWTRTQDSSEGFALMLAGVFAAFGWEFQP